MSAGNVVTDGKVKCAAVMATPFFGIGYRDGLLGRPWRAAYERWASRDQCHYERGRYFGAFCLAVNYHAPLKRAGMVRDGAAAMLRLANMTGYVP